MLNLIIVIITGVLFGGATIICLILSIMRYIPWGVMLLFIVIDLIWIKIFLL